MLEEAYREDGALAPAPADPFVQGLPSRFKLNFERGARNKVEVVEVGVYQ